jgi:serine/threonine protein kinase
MTELLHERYELLDTLGAGGEGRVVRARDTQHDRSVALKILSARGPTDRHDLLAEARTLLGLAPHPSLPLVREDFFDGDQYVIAMDWVDGTDLGTLLRTVGRPGLAPSSVLAYLPATRLRPGGRSTRTAARRRARGGCRYLRSRRAPRRAAGRRREPGRCR